MFDRVTAVKIDQKMYSGSDRSSFLLLITILGELHSVVVLLSAVREGPRLLESQPSFSCNFKITLKV